MVDNIIQIVSPIPHCSGQPVRQNNKKTSTGSQLLTKSPLIKELKEKQLVKETIERKKLERAAKRKLHFKPPKKLEDDFEHDCLEVTMEMTQTMMQLVYIAMICSAVLKLKSVGLNVFYVTNGLMLNVLE